MDNIKSSMNIARKSGTKLLASIMRRSRKNLNRFRFERNDDSLSTDLSENYIDIVGEGNKDEQVSRLNACESSENLHKCNYNVRKIKGIEEKIYNSSDTAETSKCDETEVTDFVKSEPTSSKTETQANLSGYNCVSGTSKRKNEKEYCNTIKNRRKYGSKKLIVQNIYEPLEEEMPRINNDIRHNIIQKKIVVSMDDPLRSRRSPLTTPICKTFSRGESPRDKTVITTDSENKNSVEWTIVENGSAISQSCGSTDQLDVSFSSSYGSNESISDLLSHSGDSEVDRSFDEAETHFAIFVFLRQKCREHFSNMNKISKKLRILRGKEVNDVVEDLLQTERELLISSENYLSCIANITNCNYDLDDDIVNEQSATIKISDILIPMTRRLESYAENYYVCIARSEKTMLTTKYITPQKLNGKLCLVFEEELVFEKLTKNFRIQISIYELNLNEKRRFFKRGTLSRNVNYGFRALGSNPKGKQSILHSGFKQCGAFEISLKNIEQNIVYNTFPSLSLGRQAEILKMTSNLFINTTKKGYINFGQRHAKDDIIIWNVKYAFLENSVLRIFNPSEVLDLNGKPLIEIDLQKVSSEVITHTCHLKYCIQLDLICEEPEFQFKFQYSYFLRAHTRSDFECWFKEINNVLNTLQQWNMLEYIDKF